MKSPQEERGAALVTVLLFVVLTFILVATMLVTASNEVIISALHRDGVRALELAQAGIQEAARRLEADRPTAAAFAGSINPAVSITVLNRGLGVNAAFKEIQATATVGRATRRVSSLILQEGTLLLPNVLSGHAITEPGSPTLILTGDVYSRTYIRYQDIPNSGVTYAGWRIAATPHTCTAPYCGSDGVTGPCYTHPACVALNQPNWYPAQRRSEYAATPLGADIKAWAAAHCNNGVPIADTTQVNNIRLADDPTASDPCNPACNGAPSQWLYGWARDDSPQGPKAVSAKLPCGLPYKLVPETFTAEDGTTFIRWFKTIVFEQWMDNYWQFDDSQLSFVKKPDLLSYPEFGATTPVIQVTPGNFDRHLVGGQNVSGDLGCKAPEMSCAGGVSRPTVVWLEQCGTCQDWNITSLLRGHGLLVVNGNLQINGDFEYWGTIIVTGTLILSSPNAVLHGGLIAQNTVQIDGTIKIYGGTSVGSPPVGPSKVVARAWWER